MCLAGGAAVPGAAASQAVGLSGAGALALLLAFGGAWLAALGGFSVTPPMDNIEQLVWLHALEWGYHKHPPLPTWIIAAGAALVGPEPWLSYVLGGLFTLASMLLLWHLVRELRGGAWATLVLLGALCITFYNGRLYYYNHNVVMMPCVAGMVWLLWRVTRRPSLAVWATIGALGALGMLSKYQTVVAIVCVGLWWLHLRGWRHPLHRRGLGLAAVIGLLMLAPHLAWLAAHDWAPLAYAQESSVGADLGAGARASLAVRWSADWLLSRTLPAWLLIGAVLIASRAGRHDGGGTPPVVDAPADREARAYLLLWGFGPLLLMLALGLVWGVELQMQWGTAFMLWTVPAVLELVGRAGGRLAQGGGLRVAAAGFVVIQLLMLAEYVLTSAWGPVPLRSPHWRNFPSDRLAAAVAAPARQALGGPIDIVSGPTKEAGALALRLPERPRVLIDGRLDISPWIRADELGAARIVELMPTPSLPEGARWALPGWAWRTGLPAHSQVPPPPRGRHRPAMPMAARMYRSSLKSVRRWSRSWNPITSCMRRGGVPRARPLCSALHCARLKTVTKAFWQTSDPVAMLSPAALLRRLLAPIFLLLVAARARRAAANWRNAPVPVLAGRVSRQRQIAVRETELVGARWLMPIAIHLVAALPLLVVLLVHGW